jgi:glucose/arabinose dehydrogenase
MTLHHRAGLRLLAPAVALALLCAGCGGRVVGQPAAAAVPASPTAPLETRNGNTGGYQPAFAGQTRAAGIRDGAAPEVQVVTQQLTMPWAVEPLPDGRFLVTERAGLLRIVSADGKQLQDVAGVPKVRYQGQAGLHDIALDPDYVTSHLIYLSYTEARPDGYCETLASARLVSDAAGARLEAVQVLFRQQPVSPSERKIGSRIIVGRDHKLYFTLGVHSEEESAGPSQDLGSHFGKVVRLNSDGSVPMDNPFVGRSGARPEVWSLGLRNVQAAALDTATGKIWITDHGPRGGDELNLLKAGANYGWPVISYGMDYTGKRIGTGITQQDGMEQPVYYWDPVITPSAIVIYHGTLFPEWEGSFLVGGLTGTKLVRLRMENDRVAGEEWMLQDRHARIRDVQQGPDGAVYVLTEEGAASALLRLRPKG